LLRCRHGKILRVSKSRLEALEDIIDEIKFFEVGSIFDNSRMLLNDLAFALSSRAKRTSTAIRNILSTPKVVDFVQEGV